MSYKQLIPVFILFVSIFTAVAPAENAPVRTANTDATYRALRNIGLDGGEAVSLENVVLTREFATFTFKRGTMFFLPPVLGKITGAVFVGEGSVLLAPSQPAEKHSLSLLAKSQQMNESFDVVVLRFTDSTYDELKKAGAPARDLSAKGTAAAALAENLNTLLRDKMTRYNLSARILQDLLATSPGGLFTAFIHGHTSAREAFIVDPQGITMYGLQPEEAAFVTYDIDRFGIWVANHLEREYSAGLAKGTQMNAPIHVQDQKLDVEITKSGELHGVATTTFRAVRPGLRVAPFTLFRNFQVQSVTDGSGQPLPFILEHVPYLREESDIPDNFNVILPKPLAAGEQFTIKTVYGGTGAVVNEEGGNYYPVARDDWFPYNRQGDYTSYQMTFRIPKGMKMEATGSLIRETIEGDQSLTEWKSTAAISFAGFSFGRFKSMEDKLKNGFVLLSYANEDQPGWVKGLKEIANPVQSPFIQGNARVELPEVSLGSMDTTRMLKQPLVEAELALGLYSDYFGPISYDRLAITQQTACSYGQAWPGLIWLPICSLFDSGVRHQLGLDDTRQPYWSVVVPHEVAHQWWGHTVGWASYRDQWMSEGFAQESASMFLQRFEPKNRELYRRFWGEQQQNLEQRNQWGFRPIDVGPVTMGFRLNASRIGDNYHSVVYGKGGFILHMLHWMMWDPKTGDQEFKNMMRDFASTYHDRVASTEDFKTIAEKHMTAAMDLDRNHRLDWFFNEYVYGTELPKYDLSYTTHNDGNRAFLDLKLTQSNVSPTFKMLVPVYAELHDGSVRRLGAATMTGNVTIRQSIPIGNAQLQKLMVNYYYDVLSMM